MSDIVEQLFNTAYAFKYNARELLLFIALIWGVHLVNVLLGRRLLILGIIPRNPFGLIGIFFAPWLHGNFNHLFFNSIPLFVLGGLVMLNGQAAFIFISLFVVVVSGFLVWLFGRKSIHVGASGLIMGYFGCLLTQAYFQPSAITLIVVVICLYYFGGLLSDLLPGKEEVSFEAHIFGFLAGVGSIFAYPYLNAML